MEPSRSRKNLWILTLGAMGVVFGDIGTSPLYALRECLSPERGLPPNPANVYGLISLIFWAVTLIVCIKYLIFVLRADNRGEGGILSLVSLVNSAVKNRKGWALSFIAILGILGAAFLYSDGVLTPAVSVLSAVEGLKTISLEFTPFVLPVTVAVLVFLFSFQHKGTAHVGRLFGPVMTLWFLVLAVLGVVNTLAAPQVLESLNPWHGVNFFLNNGLLGMVVLGSVFLALTGAEVLYADLGHFGTSPIRRAWFFLVFPAIVLNYMGQGAYYLSHPGMDHNHLSNLFFQLAPEWFRIPLVLLATAATVIASQAVISGAFSLARQSVQLGFWPRMQIQHTSDDTIGQVYVPFINWALMLGTIALVLGFQESSKLANAYGIAVSADMFITCCLMIFVARRIWKTPLLVVIPLAVVFLIIDLTFFAANAGKMLSGGWIVAAMALILVLFMKTWRDGRKALFAEMESSVMTLETFSDSVGFDPPTRVKGVAVFLAGNPKGVPIALLHNLKHNKVLHETTIIMSIQTVEIPQVSREHRSTLKDFGHGLYQVVLSFGFSESPDIPYEMSKIEIPGVKFQNTRVTYFLGRESLVLSPRKHTMAPWRKKIFWFMSHNAQTATSFFHLPTNQVVEISAQKDL